MYWIAKSSSSSYHAAHSAPERVTDGKFRWTFRGKTMCGRVIEGVSGQCQPCAIECAQCRKAYSRPY